MDTRAIEQVISDYRNALALSIQVQEIILFGSHLEGSATPDSDVDLIVISHDFAALSEDERLDILEDAAEVAAPTVAAIIHSWGFTPQEVAQASHLTTLGYVREEGLHFS
jgi:hypothetical protein